MKKILDVLVILDRSGSMAVARYDHEGGLATFVKEQSKLDDDVRFTLVQFDNENPCEVVYDRTPIAHVGKIELHPRGWTPLLDAIGLATAHLEKNTSNNVVCMVVTDGQENASKEYTKAMVKARVAELEKKGWTFTFLGANIDSFTVGTQLGMPMAAIADFSNDAVGVQHAYMSFSDNLTRSQKTGTVYSTDVEERIGGLAYTNTQRKQMDTKTVVK